MASRTMELNPALLKQIHDLIEGATISVDLSTGDTDCGSRLFAHVDSVFLENGKLVIVAIDPEYNH